MNYEPKPIDITGVALPEDLEQLTYLLSRNNHDVWAASRISQGWTYGEKRDDDLKHHPCLVDFDDLPAEEQAYDTDTAIGAIKLILKLGYRIVKEE